MHDAFAVIRWSGAGIGAPTASALWSLAVIAEVAVFFVIGPPLIERLSPRGAIALAAAAGMLRWAVMAPRKPRRARAGTAPRGFTFALLHLACIRIIARVVPPGLEGTAQAFYATVGIGAATAALTLLSGMLYERWGAAGFWAMAALCAARCRSRCGCGREMHHERGVKCCEAYCGRHAFDGTMCVRSDDAAEPAENRKSALRDGSGA